MDDYNRYVTAVNKIFDFLEKMKAGWNNMDNKNYIDSIDEFKGIVTSKANEFKKPPTVKLEKTSAELEEENNKKIEEEKESRMKMQQEEQPTEPEHLPTEEKIPLLDMSSAPNDSIPKVPSSMEELGE